MEIENEGNNEGHLLPDIIKHEIIHYKKEGKKKDKEIKRIIFSDFNRTLGHSTISTIWKKYKESESISNQWSTQGRPRVMKEEEKEMLIENVREDRLSSSRQLKEDLKLSASRETINRELLRKGYKAYRAPAKPLLTEDHIQQRERFAIKYQSWGRVRWRRVVFTDESAFRLVEPNGRVFVRRKEEELLEPFSFQACVPSSSMVMIWGAISNDGPGPLVRIQNNLDSEGYLNLFRYRLWRYYPDLYNGIQIFQDDNATSHNADVVNQWFDRYQIRRIEWPSRSPDINIIEDVWNKLKFEMRGKIFMSQDNLWEEIKKQWENLSPDFIDGLYESLPNRVQAVLNARGGATKY